MGRAEQAGRGGSAPSRRPQCTAAPHSFPPRCGGRIGPAGRLPTFSVLGLCSAAASHESSRHLACCPSCPECLPFHLLREGLRSVNTLLGKHRPQTASPDLGAHQGLGCLFHPQRSVLGHHLSGFGLPNPPQEGDTRSHLSQPLGRLRMAPEKAEAQGPVAAWVEAGRGPAFLLQGGVPPPRPSQAFGSHMWS